MKTMRPSILIVDDNARFRASASEMLDVEGFEVVGSVADGVSAIEAVAALSPDVVLLDIQLPDMDGLVVAERLAGVPDAPIVVLTSSHDAATYGDRLAHSSARGFIPKGALSGETLAQVVA